MARTKMHTINIRARATVPDLRGTITRDEWARLQSGSIARIHHNRASVEVTGSGDERRFTMSGPSGTHSLLVLATDCERLNAHWRVFCTDARNLY